MDKRALDHWITEGPGNFRPDEIRAYCSKCGKEYHDHILVQRQGIDRNGDEFDYEDVECQPS
jgi:hypothetical protein